MSDLEMDKFLCGVKGAVEATRFEQHALWLLNDHAVDGPKLSWVENSRGLLETVGHFGGLPVCIDMQKAIVSDFEILFYHATSLVTHQYMIEDWFEENLTKSARLRDGRLNKTNAMNFYNIFDR